MDDERTFAILESIYADCCKRELVSPDPLEFLYRYDGPDDIETVGLISSSFAYGRVASILASVQRVLDVLGPHPAAAAREMSADEISTRLGSFCHRFVKGPETAMFIAGIGAALREHGSLESLFSAGLQRGDRPGREDVLCAMDSFAAEILRLGGLESSHLMPRASKGSACKRLAMFLRWMVRRDEVDLGCWSCVPSSAIIIPLDTHMFTISRGLGFIKTSSANGRAALAATDGFARLCPDDPVRYDFALTRYGIRHDMSEESLLAMLTG